VRFRAAIFDLFHTLTGFESEWSELPWTSDVLGIDRKAWDHAIQHSSHARLCGHVREPVDIVRSLAHAIDRSIPEARILEAARVRTERFRHALQRIPPQNVATLARLRQAGLKLGLISNADAMEFAPWPQSPLCGRFDVEVFSCEAGCAKPDAAIFHRCLEGLALAPRDCIFIGDGGSDELAAAKAVGMSTVLISGVLAALWPERISERLKSADHHIREIPEVLPILGVA
jgi:putative hydrolase of the HAD superfamily